jgi:hypothetical protein
LNSTKSCLFVWIFSWQVCAWLFEHGFDFTVLNKARHGALDSAVWRGHVHIVRWLLLDESGPRLGPQLLLRDLAGRDIVTVARDGGHRRLAMWLRGCVAVFRQCGAASEDWVARVPARQLQGP